MRALAKVLVLVALWGSLLQPPTRAVAPESSDAVATVVGQGRGGRAMCIGCGIAIIGAAGATWGGLILASMFHPEAVLACGYICYGAFRT